jgi:hypothetical protein
LQGWNMKLNMVLKLFRSCKNLTNCSMNACGWTAKSAALPQRCPLARR